MDPLVIALVCLGIACAALYASYEREKRSGQMLRECHEQLLALTRPEAITTLAQARVSDAQIEIVKAQVAAAASRPPEVEEDFA